MRKAYRIWTIQEGLRCDGFYEVEDLEDVFTQIMHFEYGRGYNRKAHVTVEECEIENDCDICSDGCVRNSFRIDLPEKKEGEEKYTWEDILARDLAKRDNKKG